MPNINNRKSPTISFFPEIKQKIDFIKTNIGRYSSSRTIGDLWKYLLNSIEQESTIFELNSLILERVLLLMKDQGVRFSVSTILMHTEPCVYNDENEERVDSLSMPRFVANVSCLWNVIDKLYSSKPSKLKKITNSIIEETVNQSETKSFGKMDYILTNLKSTFSKVFKTPITFNSTDLIIHDVSLLELLIKLFKFENWNQFRKLMIYTNTIYYSLKFKFFLSESMEVLPQELDLKECDLLDRESVLKLRNKYCKLYPELDFWKYALLEWFFNFDIAKLTLDSCYEVCSRNNEQFRNITKTMFQACLLYSTRLEKQLEKQLEYFLSHFEIDNSYFMIEDKLCNIFNVSDNSIVEIHFLVQQAFQNNIKAIKTIYEHDVLKRIIDWEQVVNIPLIPIGDEIEEITGNILFKGMRLREFIGEFNFVLNKSWRQN